MTHITDPQIEKALLLVKQAKEEEARFERLKEQASIKGDHHKWAHYLEMQRYWIGERARRAKAAEAVLLSKAETN